MYIHRGINVATDTPFYMDGNVMGSNVCMYILYVGVMWRAVLL